VRSMKTPSVKCTTLQPVGLIGADLRFFCHQWSKMLAPLFAP